MLNLKSLAFAGVSLFAMATPAMAQNTAPSGDAGVDANEIVVSARRRDEDVQDVPVVVQAVTAETLEKLNLRRFEDIASVVPGLSLRANANGIGVTATVRGVNYDVNVSGNNGTIQFYQNDVPVSAGLLFNALFDVGQIEVLRGPQGTLKGRSSPSGSITLFTRRPNLSEVGASADFTVNDIKGWNGRGTINVPVLEDKLAIRLAGVLTEGRGSRVHDIVNTTEPRDKTRGVRASVKADPFDGLLELDFAYQNVDARAVSFDQAESVNQIVSGSAASPVTIAARDRLGVVGTARANNQEFTTYDWTAKLRLMGQALTYLGGRSTQHLVSIAPSDAAGVFSVDSAGTNLFGQRSDTLSQNESHEIRLQNEERVAGIFDYVAGALFATGSSDTNFGSITGIALGGASPRLLNVVVTPIFRFGTNKEESYFGNLTAHIGDATEISGGVRRIKYTDASGLSVNGVVNTLLARNFTERKTIYSASIKHNFGDNLMVYASTGTSWRPSTVAIGGPTGGISALQLSFLGTAPETSKSYEIGFKSSLLDNRLKINVTAFDQKFENYPFRSASGIFAIDRTNSANPSAIAFNYVAAVPAKVQGVEAEVSYRPSDHFSIGGILSYAKGTFNGLIPCLDLNNDGNPDVVSTPPTLAQLEADVGANNIGTCSANLNATAAPRWSGSVQSEYTQPIGSTFDGYIRGLFDYKGFSANDPVNAFDDVKAYGILNLYAGLRDKDGAWELSLFAKNITNTFRVLNRSNGPVSTTLRGGIPLGGGAVSSGSLSTTNYFGISSTLPREFGINLRMSIGSR